MKEVEGKVALVTGAARGLGAETAKLLAQEGAKVVLTDMRKSEGEATADALVRAGAAARFCLHDVTGEEEWKRAVGFALDAFGQLDILVNNAGVLGANQAIEDMTLADWRRVLAVNLDGVFLGLKHGVGALKARGGSIINLSSIAGIVGFPSAADYCASKGGVRLLTKAAALECAQHGYRIRVNSVHPGFVPTDMVKDYIGTMTQAGIFPSFEAGEATIRAEHPIGRLGEPLDIAQAILFLASDRSAWVTGAEFVIDGGYTARCRERQIDCLNRA